MALDTGHLHSRHSSVLEDYQIEQLDKCYQIITALGGFLTTLNIPVDKENVDTMENEDGEKATNIPPPSLKKSDGPIIVIFIQIKSTVSAFYHETIYY